jgi:hypothetical protein
MAGATIAAFSLLAISPDWRQSEPKKITVQGGVERPLLVSQIHDCRRNVRPVAYSPLWTKSSLAAAHRALGRAYGSPERERWLLWAADGHRDWLEIPDSDHCNGEGQPTRRRRSDRA